MKFDLSKRPTRHSYSSISRYKECPARYGYQYLAGLREPSTAAMDRGTRLHSLAEHYMKSHQDVPCPYDLKRIGLKLYQLRAHQAKPEEVWCVNKQWEPVDEKDPSGWIKAIIDVHYVNAEVLHIHDYKSGRQYPSHADQLELYTAVGLCRYPTAKRAESGAIYIDTGNEGAVRSVIREMLPAIIRKWSGDIGRMEGDESFLPAPGSHCKRCPLGVSKGGPCAAEWREPR